MDALKGTKSFNGSGDVKAFIEKVGILSSLKGYTDEKLAQSLASKLEGSAFDVYLRMSVDDRKDYSKIKTELLNEYEVGQVDRERAALELSSRSRLQDEPAKTFAYKIEELAKLAYPNFTAEARGIVAKDAYVKGLHPDMQLHLKTQEKFATADLKALVTETNRLEVAGIKSSRIDRNKMQVHLVNDVTPKDCNNPNEVLMDSFAKNIIQKMDEHVNFVRKDFTRGDTSGNTRNFNYSGYRSNYNRGNSNRGNRRSNGFNNAQRRCRNCDSPNHLVRQCPSRFCASCGKTGHDAWSRDCPKYR